MAIRTQSLTYPPHVLSTLAETHEHFPVISVYSLAFDVYDPRRTAPPIYCELLNVRGVYFNSTTAALGDT